jgi:hypothetical protein
MSIRFAGAALLALLVLGAVPALAAKPKTEAQADAAALKASMVKTFKNTKSLAGVKIGKVVCVLPKNGATFHCTASTTAPSAHEDIVFKVAATLHDNDALSVTWKLTGQSCSDSGTHKSIQC